MSSIDRDKPVMEEMPSAYRRWRNWRLRQFTDALERQLIVALVGPVTGRDVLDTGCGDGELAVAVTNAGTGCPAELLSGADRLLSGRLLFGGAFPALLASRPATESDETRRFA